ncbi:hypothetical protein [Moorella sp. E306M]|uniref:hypothetical protein n=1 Tax=Moorella sp. E306M TaxID=2572683 RepID=UPI0010FFB43D|nr:hypothetical protein [Moorella sp. E306M]GEA17475.1 hypothetical protein E306M_06090 [Moorella sp. E306M]
MLKQKLTSRKFWAAVATAVFIVLSEGLGLNIDKDLYWKLVALALGYTFGEAVVDVARAKGDNSTSEGSAGSDNSSGE